MPVDNEADVRVLFERALVLFQESGTFTRDRYKADIEDHFYYIGAICPQNFRSLQHEVVNLAGKYLTFFNFSFSTWLYLLQAAPDSCVEQLFKRLVRTNQDCPAFILETMLAAIGTPAALAVMAEYAEHVHEPDLFKDYGFWLPGKGKSAEPRFTCHRSAIYFQPVRVDLHPHELAQRTHPAGLPIPFFAEGSAQDAIVWHYLTLDLAQIAGIPPTAFSQVHLVSPLLYGAWMLFCTISPQNLYTKVRLEDEMGRVKMHLQEQTIDRRGEVFLLPYDDQLLYCNGHTQLTKGVHGDVGGPPLGLGENPSCPICKKLMFHVCTVASTLREYGDGFRSLFLCEECMQVACQAAG